MIKKDCKYYVGSKPCVFHKQTLISCEKCQKHTPIQRKILIIKLGAMGDVLRTTAILHKLQNPNTEITWLTKQNSIDLLKNQSIDRIIDAESNLATGLLNIEKFDQVYSLDNDYEGAVLGEMATANKKFGYGVDKKGKLYGCNKAAEEWLETSIDDNLKKANQKTFQSWLFAICGLEFDNQKDTITLPDTWHKSDPKNIKSQLKTNKKNCAIVIGAGNRWPEKSLSLKNIKKLINLFTKNNYNILLIGGPDETEKMTTLIKNNPHTINTGTNNSIPELIAILNLSDLIITPDTLSMHIGIALKKATYTYIGPTSPKELEEYGLMTKLIPDLDCICCYNSQCNKEKKCNELVSFDVLIEKEKFTT